MRDTQRCQTMSSRFLVSSQSRQRGHGPESWRQPPSWTWQRCALLRAGAAGESRRRRLPQEVLREPRIAASECLFEEYGESFPTPRGLQASPNVGSRHRSARAQVQALVNRERIGKRGADHGPSDRADNTEKTANQHTRACTPAFTHCVPSNAASQMSPPSPPRSSAGTTAPRASAASPW